MKEQKITKFLKLPFHFSEQKLVKDSELIIKNQWVPHFNKTVYEGKWKSISLYAINGDEKIITAMNSNNSKIKETPIIRNCLYFKEVVQNFKCPLLSVRLLRLGAGGFIKPHEDYRLGYEDGTFRLHIPIVTNPDVDFILDGVRLEMLPGECWYTNVNYTHSVHNNGKSDRIHLVIDGKRNQWSDNLFFSLAPKESFKPIPEKNQYSLETIAKMIEALKEINTTAINQMIIDLQSQLDFPEKT